MPPNGYGNYRGRDPIWKKFVAALLVLVIAAALGAIYLQSNLVYDDQGVAHLKTPWAQEEAPEAEPPPAVSPPADGPLNIIVEDTDRSPKTLQCVQLSAKPLTVAAWEAEGGALPAGEGLNALAVTVKDAKGLVYYDSLTAKAVNQKKLVRAAEDTAEAILAMNGACAYTVARMSALLDPIASRERLDEMGLKNTGKYIFYDLYSGTWLDPSKQGTLDYLAALAKECAALGFDEILLTDLSYPTAGKLDKIDYGPAGETENGRSAALCGVVAYLRSALAERWPEVKVSVELPVAVVVNGADEAAGLVLADIARAADRIYVPASAAEAPVLAEAVEKAGGEGTPCFVPELAPAASSGELASWLRLAE